MRLALFILQHKEPILREWEDFARTLQPAASGMNVAALRDHPGHILDTIIAQLGQVESEQETFDKSRGHGVDRNEKSYAEIHAMDR